LSQQIASFIRQLNLYKMVRMSQLALLEDLNDSGGRVDGELTHTGFSHPHLQKDRAELLHLIKRRFIRDATHRLRLTLYGMPNSTKRQETTEQKRLA
jgi:hypothetical protein